MTRVCVLQGFGINADLELIEAFQAAGASPEGVHVSAVLRRPERLREYNVLAFPGGFSFGDHLGSGRVLATLLNVKLRAELESYIDAGGLVIGICNGFQVLVKLGLLPADSNDPGNTRQTVSLIHNTSGRFVDRWVHLKRNPANKSPWLGTIDAMDVPVRHGEGRFVCADHELSRLQDSGQIAFHYASENPNGSLAAIAGITDPSGRVLGMMPHPEAYLCPENHPLWHRRRWTEPLGTAIFRNAVAFSEGGQ